MTSLVHNRVVVPMINQHTLKHEFDVIVYGRTAKQIKFLACEELQAVRKKYLNHSPGPGLYEPPIVKGDSNGKRNWR